MAICKSLQHDTCETEHQSTPNKRATGLDTRNFSIARRIGLRTLTCFILGPATAVARSLEPTALLAGRHLLQCSYGSDIDPSTGASLACAPGTGTESSSVPSHLSGVLIGAMVAGGILTFVAAGVVINYVCYGAPRSNQSGNIDHQSVQNLQTLAANQAAAAAYQNNPAFWTGQTPN